MKLNTLVILLLSLVCTSAQAEDYQQYWEQLHEALLKESVDGDLDGAIKMYDYLGVHLSPLEETGPILVEALYQLGYGHFKNGETEKARIKLKECIRVSNSERCRNLLSRIALGANAIDTLPLRWDFEDRQHGFVLLSGVGSVTVVKQDEVSALRWALPSGQNPDTLAIHINTQGTKPQKARLFASLERGERLIYPVAEDRNGKRFVLKKGPLQVNAVPRLLEFSFKDFVALSDDKDPLNLDELYLLEFHERRVNDSRESEHSALRMDWFELL